MILNSANNSSWCINFLALVCFHSMWPFNYYFPSMPRLYLKHVCNSFSQSSHVSFCLSLLPSTPKLCRLDRPLRSINLSSIKAGFSWKSYISCKRLSMWPKFSYTCATLSSKTCSVCFMFCLNSLTFFFKLSICCFEISKLPLIILNKFCYCSSTALVIIFSISIVNFSSVYKVASCAIFECWN